MDLKYKKESGVLYSEKELRAMGRKGAMSKFGTQLPANFFLMMSRVLSVSDTGGSRDKGYGVAEYDVDPKNLLFRVHFADMKVLPAVMILEGVQQFVGLAGFHLGCRGQGLVAGAGPCRSYKMIDPHIGTLRCEVDIQSLNTRRKPHLIRANGNVYDQKEELVFTVQDVKIAFMPASEL